MLRGLLIGLFLAAALPAVAQDEKAEDQRPQAKAEKPERRGKGGTAGPQSANLTRMADRMVASLNLTPEQKTKVDQMVAEHNQKREELRQLIAEMIRAPKTEDPEKYEQLRSRVTEMQTKLKDPVGWLAEDIEKVLEPGQAERLRAVREQMAHGGAVRPRNDRALLHELRADLELTPEQSAQLDAMLAQGGDSHGQHAQGQGGATSEELKPLLEDLKQAREQRDRQRILEIQEKLAGMESSDSVDWDDLLTRLAPILNEGQLEKLEAFETRLDGGADGAGPDEVRDIFRAARRVGLTGEQARALRDMQRGLRRKHGRGVVPDEAERQNVVTELREQLKTLLDTEQYRRFEANLQKLRKRDKR
jgi:hypothetical protein